MCILEKLNFKISRGSVSLDPPTELVPSALDPILAGPTLNCFRRACNGTQYQKMIGILRSFIRSVRTGSWSLYLKSLCDMHPYLAAAGHNNYTKSLALFIPRMVDLGRTHPDVHAAFTKRLFPVRITEGAWTGIFTDLFIEQVQMAGIKFTGV